MWNDMITPVSTGVIFLKESPIFMDALSNFNHPAPFDPAGYGLYAAGKEP